MTKAQRKTVKNTAAGITIDAAGADADPFDQLLNELGDGDGRLVRLYRFNSAGTQEFCEAITPSEFNLEAVAHKWGGGKFRAVIIDAATKQYQSSHGFTVAARPAAALQPGPVISPSPAPPPADRLVEVLIAQNNTLLQGIVAQRAAAPAGDSLKLRDILPLLDRRGGLSEVLEGIAAVKALAKQEGGGGDDAGGLGAIAGLLGELIKARGSGQLPPGQGAAAAAPPGQGDITPPPAAQVDITGLLGQAVPILAAGNATQGDPATYAELIDDLAVAAGAADALELLAHQAPAGELTALFITHAPALAPARAWLGQVEAALRERFKPEASPGDITAAAPPVTTKPAPGDKKQ